MIKKIIIGIIILAIGFGIGSSDKPVTTVTQTVEVEKNITEWQSLKSIDDQGFVIAADNMDLCNSGFKAVVNLDTNEMSRVAKEVNANTEKLSNLSNQRKVVLTKLGY